MTCVAKLCLSGLAAASYKTIVSLIFGFELEPGPVQCQQSTCRASPYNLAKVNLNKLILLQTLSKKNDDERFLEQLRSINLLYKKTLFFVSSLDNQLKFFPISVKETRNKGGENFPPPRFYFMNHTHSERRGAA